MSTTTAVSMEGVTYSYNGPNVLENVCLLIETGDFVSIVGPNGGGKTTLLRLILGLLTPQQGTISVLGKKPRTARPEVGYVPQHHHFDPQFPVTVLDVAMMGRLCSGMCPGPYRRADRDAVRRALELVEMKRCETQPFASLSGGQRQRVLIARALASEPRLLLLDEPTANVDLLIMGDLYDLLREINQSMTVVLVSHDLGFVSRLVKRVVCVNRKVVTHPANAISGAQIHELYGTEVDIVRHDLECDEGNGS